MARGFSYVLVTDSGFAPNPFHGFLTLATCKPMIRKAAQAGDYLIGVAPAKLQSKLVYMARISEVITFDEYWNNDKYSCKKPIMTPSGERSFGDNIYHRLANGSWKQAASLHQEGQMGQDTARSDHVLIAREFFYFGKAMIAVPDEFCRCIHHGRAHHCLTEVDCQKLWNYLCAHYKQGMIDTPRQYDSFLRKMHPQRCNSSSNCAGYVC